MQIQNSNFLVSGGASGLGLAVVRKLILEGASVASFDLNPSAVATLSLEGDIRSEKDAQSCVNKVIEVFGSLHGLVNCAGLAPGMRVLGKRGSHTLDLFQKVIDVNLVGTFNLLRLVVEKMQNNHVNEQGERGIIINTASVAAFEGQIGQAAYSASKGGIVSMTLPIARELAPMGIRVMSIAPGIFETPLMDAYSEELKVSLGSQVPFPSRLGKPSEFADLVEHVINNVMLNGEVIRLDGGIRMAPR